jgi:hypothetical protein
MDRCEGQLFAHRKLLECKRSRVETHVKLQ